MELMREDNIKTEHLALKTISILNTYLNLNIIKRNEFHVKYKRNILDMLVLIGNTIWSYFILIVPVKIVFFFFFK